MGIPSARTALVPVLLLAGCLKFGRDVETTSPSASDLQRCRAEMYLEPDLDLTPLGFKLEGSGIDDAIWFKFRTEADDLSQVFQEDVVDISSFQEGFSSLYPVPGLSWWDVEGKAMYGGQVRLPLARVMNVGAVSTESGLMVYVLWHQT